MFQYITSNETVEYGFVLESEIDYIKLALNSLHFSFDAVYNFKGACSKRTKRKLKRSYVYHVFGFIKIIKKI